MQPVFEPILTRRHFLSLLLGLCGALLVFPLIGKGAAMAKEQIEKLIKTDKEWEKLLSPSAYDVLRRKGTEPPFSSPLNDEHRRGVFVCAACGLSLFPSAYKFDSGTGWPSFFDVLPGHVETQEDRELLEPRTEYHCARCGGHQGHVFNDGPPPTGLRYCNNGVALRFEAEKEGS